MNQEKLYQIILAPHVTEKTSLLTDQKQLVFKVLPTAKKADIKAAVEFLFEVKVASVNTVRVKGKNKRFGMRMGRRQDYKKAYVTFDKSVDMDALLAQQG